MKQPIRTHNEIKHYIESLYEELYSIENNTQAGRCYWRICRAKIDMLHWVLNEE